MSNSNAAGIDVIGDGNSAGSTVGASATELVGMHGVAVVQATVTGARDEVEGAMVSLLNALAAKGIIVDGTTAS